MFQLVEVSESTQGAAIEILDGKRSVTYRPPVNMTEPDQFTYVIEDEQGARATATVTIEPEIIEDTVAVSLQITDSTGNTIRQVAAGETFWLELQTQDLRTAGTGVFAVFADVEFDPSSES